jgi:hypothetical protein
MYVDESGTPGDRESEYFVMAGIAVFERSMLGLSRALDAIQDRYIPHYPGLLEFHASEIRSPRGGTYWRAHVERVVREQIIEEIGQVIGNPQFLNWVKLFGVAIQKQFLNHDSSEVYERALNELCKRFDLFLQKQQQLTNQHHYGMLIFDESQLQTETRKLMYSYRTGQHEWVTTGRIVEVPFFADSRETRLLQAADYVAYSLFRRYEHGDISYFDRIGHAFYADSDVIHGLKHLHDSFNTCLCPACLSRRKGYLNH